MIMIMVVVATVGGVVLLLPLSRRLGALLEAMTREREDSPGMRRAVVQLRQSMETLEERLELLEEKQDFTEQLLGERNRKSLKGGVEERGAKGSSPDRTGEGG